MIKKLFSNIATVLGIIIIYTTVWTIDNFGHASIDEILFTISSPIKGFDYNLAFSYLYFILLLCFLYELIFILLFRIKKYEFKKIYLLISIGVFIFGCYYLECNFNVVNYLSVSYTQTDIYSKESSYDPAIYVNPEEVKITGEKTNNLIFIYLESIENTFADIKNGGINEINFIPELTDLAKDNVSFSNTSLLGGPFNTSGSTWTIGSMVCQMGGLPLKNLIGNNMSEYDYFILVESRDANAFFGHYYTEYKGLIPGECSIGTTYIYFFPGNGNGYIYQNNLVSQLEYTIYSAFEEVGFGYY